MDDCATLVDRVEVVRISVDDCDLLVEGIAELEMTSASEDNRAIFEENDVEVEGAIAEVI